MIVWRITGEEIGPNGCWAAHFAKKSDADKALREYRKRNPEVEPSGPEKIEVRGRDDLAWHLDNAMGFGGS